MRKWRKITLVLLGLTACAHIAALLRPASVLAQADPVFGVQDRLVVGAAAVLEVLACLCLWLARGAAVGARFVFVLAALMAAYQVSMFPYPGQMVTPAVLYWWPWLGRNEGSLLTSVAFWLLITSAFVAVRPQAAPSDPAPARESNPGGAAGVSAPR